MPGDEEQPTQAPETKEDQMPGDEEQPTQAPETKEDPFFARCLSGGPWKKVPNPIVEDAPPPPSNALDELVLEAIHNVKRSDTFSGEDTDKLLTLMKHHCEDIATLVDLTREDPSNIWTLLELALVHGGVQAYKIVYFVAEVKKKVTTMLTEITTEDSLDPAYEACDTENQHWETDSDAEVVGKKRRRPPSKMLRRKVSR